MRNRHLRAEGEKLILSLAAGLFMLILFLAYVCSQAEARKATTSQSDRPEISLKEEGRLKGGKRGRRRWFGRRGVKEKKPALEEKERLPAYVSPYATTEELLLPREIGALRRAFVTTEPLLNEGRIVTEQALFESYARREEETFYKYAIEAIEEKPWWRDLLESLSAVAKYSLGYYSNYFNNQREEFPKRRRNRLGTETTFLGGRMVKRGVLSMDSNYFANLEHFSLEHVSLDPRTVKSHGGQARLLYRPSRRFHFLFYDDFAQSEKIAAVDDRLGTVSTTGGHTASNRLAGQFRYFLTKKDVIDLNFVFDYSRTKDGNELRIARGYQPKISFSRAFSRRLILRGFWSYDYLMTKNKAEPEASFRHEPGLGGTFVLGKRLVLDLDYSRQYLRGEGQKGSSSRGNQVRAQISHSLTRRLTHSHILTYSNLQGKRSSTSKITKEDPTTDTIELSPGTFEALSVVSQLSYRLTKLISLSVTFGYTMTDAGTPDVESNNQKKLSVDLTRPIFGKRADLGLTYKFEKNDGARASSYLSHTVLLGITTKLGVGGGRGE